MLLPNVEREEGTDEWKELIAKFCKAFRRVEKRRCDVQYQELLYRFRPGPIK
jgi:hypothetical protein